jgi:hypothetical protein
MKKFWQKKIGRRVFYRRQRSRDELKNSVSSVAFCEKMTATICLFSDSEFGFVGFVSDFRYSDFCFTRDENKNAQRRHIDSEIRVAGSALGWSSAPGSLR